jgi:hypothetical protein
MKPLATIPCDNCGERTGNPTTCEHGWECCDRCAPIDCCQGCDFERTEAAAVRREATRNGEL